MSRKNGRPRRAFSAEEIDFAKLALGRLVFASRAARAIQAKLGVGRDAAYELIAAAREQAIQAFQQAGSADDPLTACSLFFMTTMADGRHDITARVAAGAQLAKLLALDRYAARLGETGVEEFLAGLVARQAARRRDHEGHDEP